MVVIILSIINWLTYTLTVLALTMAKAMLKLALVCGGVQMIKGTHYSP